MKTVRRILPLLVMALATVALAQSDAHQSMDKPAHSDAAKPAAQTDAQKAFEKLKSVAGSWVGQLTTSPVEPSVEGNFAQFSLRVTSLGNALVHEMSISGRPDHPVTMFYLENDRLMLTHYCDAGNRPRMTGTVSPDGKTLEFNFVDLSGGNQYGHMHHAVFTFLDANHHTEDWTWMEPGGKLVHAVFNLQRTNQDSAAAGK